MPNRRNLTRIQNLLILPLALIVILTSCLTVPALADDWCPEFQSDVVYMENLNTGRIVFSKNAEKRAAQASVTKVTTFLVLTQYIRNYDDVVTVTQDELNEIKDPQSSSAGIKAGEQLTVRQLLNIMLIKSANECAIILAHYACGSTQAFVDRMNEYVTSIGCTNTHYMNPHGLTASGHYTTAKDLAIIGKRAYNNSMFRQITSQQSYTLPPTNLRTDSTVYMNPNMLLRTDSKYYYPGVTCGKTGYTGTAGRCLISFATRNGHTYMLITLGGSASSQKPNKYSIPFEDAKLAYDAAFNYNL